MKKVRNLIIIVSIIAVILLVSILIINKQKPKEEKNVATPEIEEERPYETKEGITRVEYNVLNKIATTYIQALNIDESIYATVDENGKEIIPDINLKKNVLDLLSKEYVEENNITEKNLDKYIDLLEEKLLFIPVKMKAISTGTVKSYVVNGLTINFEYELQEEINIIINVDYNNRTFSVQPAKSNYDEINSINQIKNIEKNEKNIYSNTGVNMENIVKDYMTNMKRMGLAKPELLYQYLNEEYRNKRFGNIEEFKSYIKKNAEEIKQLNLNQYMVNTYEDYVEYVAKDKYGNIYVFKEKEPLNYTVELDDYTIEYEKYAEEYSAASEEYKVANNINKWVKMINHRDYKAAYNVLDEAYKNNYFKTLEDFENYMKRYFPSHYEVDFGDFSKESGSIYTMEITFKDMSNENNNFDRTVIMKLKEGTDFVMSMNVFIK